MISFADPYYNGIISAYYFSLKNIYPDLPIKIVVNWQEETFAGQGIISGRIIPIVFFYQLLIFIFSPHSIKTLWQLRGQKK